MNNNYKYPTLVVCLYQYVVSNRGGAWVDLLLSILAFFKV